jgi:hypothetical protein
MKLKIFSFEIRVGFIPSRLFAAQYDLTLSSRASLVSYKLRTDSLILMCLEILNFLYKVYSFENLLRRNNHQLHYHVLLLLSIKKDPNRVNSCLIHFSTGNFTTSTHTMIRMTTELVVIRIVLTFRGRHVRK